MDTLNREELEDLALCLYKMEGAGIFSCTGSALLLAYIDPAWGIISFLSMAAGAVVSMIFAIASEADERAARMKGT